MKKSANMRICRFNETYTNAPAAERREKERKIMEYKEQYYIVRCDRAGVFFGKIKERNGEEVVMTDVRKLWYWEGACAVEQLAEDGTANPGGCQFTVTVSEMTVMGAIQVIPCTGKAVESLMGVAEWKR